MQLAVGVRRGLLEDMIKFSKRSNRVDKGKRVQNYENMGHLGDYEMLEWEVGLRRKRATCKGLCAIIKQMDIILNNTIRHLADMY